MTDIIIGKRGSGKTTELIKRSNKTGCYILTDSNAGARFISEAARDMVLDIPFPVTLREYLQGNKFQGSSIRRDGLLVDDADLVFQYLLYGIPINAVTITDRGNVSTMKSITDVKLDKYVIRGDIKRRLEIADSIEKVTGLSMEELLKNFMAGYTLKSPNVIKLRK